MSGRLSAVGRGPYAFMPRRAAKLARTELLFALRGREILRCAPS